MMVTRFVRTQPYIAPRGIGQNLKSRLFFYRTKWIVNFIYFCNSNIMLLLEIIKNDKTANWIIPNRFLFKKIKLGYVDIERNADITRN